MSAEQHSNFDHAGAPGDAVALGVHRNPVANRVKRLLDLLDVEGDNAGHRLLLQLTCRVPAQPTARGSWSPRVPGSRRSI
ncbi:helix-turn-helix domain-containing protein [Nonomuraea sp. NPDC059007]|uniref:helix-turn-helix domain-containing protein n=1 Tax=Nonomuraea sp. NPDC059007 TaxID=3346692 RepID=UPI0036936243